MNVRATGQFTIIDYNDALSLTGFISSNVAKTQIFNPDNGTFIPDWSTSPHIVLTPSLFIMGTSVDVINTANVQSIKWYDAANPNTELVNGATYGIPASGTKTLTIKQNLLAGNLSAKDYICEAIYRDTSTNLNLPCKMTISLSQIVNGGGITAAVAITPNGNIFKNGAIAALTGEVDLWRGGVVDRTLVTYQWYKKDTAVVTDEGAGIGWRKLTSANNFGTSGYTTRTITVPASAVLNIGVFKVSIKDTDTTSATYNQVFWESLTFVDQSDPLQVSVESTGGDVFKNGQGSTVLTARIFQGGEEIDLAAPFSYTYRWYKYNKDAQMDPNFGGTGVSHKTGKTLTVDTNDVQTKATFRVEVS